MGRSWRRKLVSGLLAGVVGLAVLAGFSWLLVRGPWYFERAHLAGLEPAQATAVTGFRQAVVAISAALVALVGLIFTARTLHLSREGHVTDRFTKAVEQLGSAVIEVRLGGIYALERIMRDSAKDHSTVLEVLAAFVRERASAQNSITPTADVQAALTVLGRRPKRHEPFALDLSKAHLRGPIFSERGWSAPTSSAPTWSAPICGMPIWSM